MSDIADHWLPTAAYARAAIAAVVLTLIALVWRRPDVLVLAAPFGIVTGWSWSTRPRGPVAATTDLGHPTIREGDATTWRSRVSVDSSLDLAVAALADERWIETWPASGSVTCAGTGGAADLAIGVRSVRWGRRTLESASVLVASPWAAFRCVIEPERATLTTLPLPSPFDVDAAPRPADGLVGLHRSGRPGEGNEFAGIRQFQTGDRMRRINWTRTARAGELMVNSTWADLDLHVSLIVDASDDFGISGGIDGRASSLDSSVRAAGAIAEHYAPSGERVSLRTFGATVANSVTAGTGRRQLRRILDTLARVQPAEFATAVSRSLATRQLGSVRDHVTVMLSPLIAPEALDLAMAIGRRGAPIIVIDTLPDDVGGGGNDIYTDLAWRIRLLERRQEVRAVLSAGIPVVRWQGPGSLDQVIRDIARRSTGPRMVRR